MAQISLLSGITSQANGDFRTSLPINLVPVPKDTGISKGYLRFAPGLTQLGTGPGLDRGGIVMGSTHFRVMGGELVTVSESGAISSVGAVAAGSDMTPLDYSFDYLCVVSAGKAYLCTSSAVTQITDPDIGVPTDVTWIDGYFAFTDGTYLYVTELANPFSIDPLKYGSSEIDPDRVVGVLKHRNELYALNRYTIEVFDNTGGTGFPFTRLPGGLIAKGCVGTKAKCSFADTFAWVGSGRNEPCSVYVASGGSAQKIATREVEERLAAYTEAQLANVLIEARADRQHQHLILHLPGETLVYDAAASLAVQEPVWFFLSTGIEGVSPYRARNFTFVGNRWVVGDTQDGRIGYVDESLCTQYGEVVGWQFDTMLTYNGGKGAQVHCLELVGTTGRSAGAADAPSVFHSYTLDGQNWIDERRASMGARGNSTARVQFRRRGRMGNFRGERFRGANATPVSWARLEAELEGLNA